MAKLLILIILVFIVVWVIASFSSQASRKQATFGNMQVAPQLWRRLVKLTRDENTAHRLVNNLLLKNPDRDANWCCEKAIYDLERDRYRR
jgi:hypothetical protein